MGNSARKALVVRVTPISNPELFPVEALILEEEAHGRVKKHRRPNYRDLITSMHILTALIGNLNSPYRKLGRAGLLLWLLNMAVNFMYDGYESHVKYGYPWMCVRGFLLATCCVGTWFTVRGTMPWLERGLGNLESNKLYRKALCDMAGTTKVSCNCNMCVSRFPFLFQTSR